MTITQACILLLALCAVANAINCNCISHKMKQIEFDLRQLKSTANIHRDKILNVSLIEEELVRVNDRLNILETKINNEKNNT